MAVWEGSNNDCPHELSRLQRDLKRYAQLVNSDRLI